MSKKQNIEDIYKEHDEATVEANKKLPKPCYGNSWGYYCGYKCEVREGCYGITMKKWGPCDCKFKPSCHVPRQTIQVEWKKEVPEHICEFLKYFDVDSYPEIIIPDGIIKMKPIED